MLPRAPLGRIVNDLCFSPDNVFSIGCILALHVPCLFSSARPLAAILNNYTL